MENKCRKLQAYGVILAGGGGTRFWPLSRKSCPKQFLNVSGKDSLLNETIHRLQPLIPMENTYIVTNATQQKLVQENVPEGYPMEQVLAEPASRNTAACIGYAALELVRKYGDAVMCIFPADHYIRQEDKFREILKSAIDLVEEKDCLTTIGITPTFPSTGFGYIRYQKDKIEKSISEQSHPLQNNENQSYPVQSFVEKPDEETAKKYLASGEYAWNSGMFIWKASTILSYFEKLLPDVYKYLLQIKQAMQTSEEQLNTVLWDVYPKIPSISIDYGIMEKADYVYVIPGEFGWDDVGSISALENLWEKDKDGNVVVGMMSGIDVSDCIFYSKNRLIAGIGLKGMAVVDGGDSVLVCPKERVQDIKKLVEQLGQQGLDQYL